ncbi:unnamed protein product [Gongylonema pulchrum]|uniref:BACK domain-containing protein n=1 Tax=Gongylonema pulchrum TaxID=637853 RepID=A0A3P6PT94_9BILA|nr:unnamed protein product [Gongylonema pulchrum]
MLTLTKKTALPYGDYVLDICLMKQKRHFFTDFQVFEYVLYTVNETVVSGRNLDFFRLKHEHLYEILDADLLNVDNELEVWLLLRRWILADRKNRLRLFRKLIKSVRYYQLNDKQKEKMNKDLLQMKIDITNENNRQWSSNITPRIPRELLVAIGGWEKTGPSNTVEVLDIKNNIWRRVEAFQDERKVAYHECLVIDKVCCRSYL